MEYTIKEKKEYLVVVNEFYKNNKIPLEFLFNYYQEKEGKIKDINLFAQAFNQWSMGKIQAALAGMFSILNMKFEVLIVTKEDKFIIAT